MIDVARKLQGQTAAEFLKNLNEASARFKKATKDKFVQKGEW